MDAITPGLPSLLFAHKLLRKASVGRRRPRRRAGVARPGRRRVGPAARRVRRRGRARRAARGHGRARPRPRARHRVGAAGLVDPVPGPLRDAGAPGGPRRRRPARPRPRPGRGPLGRQRRPARRADPPGRAEPARARRSEADGERVQAAQHHAPVPRRVRVGEHQAGEPGRHRPRDAARASARASTAPRQWWIPPPKERWWGASRRRRSRRSALGPEVGRVAVRAAEAGEHERLGRDLLAAQLEVVEGDAPGELHRAVVAEQLVDRVADQRRVPTAAAPAGRGGAAARGCRCRSGSRSSRARRGTGARPGPGARRGEPVAFLLGRDERAQQVVARARGASTRSRPARARSGGPRRPGCSGTRRAVDDRLEALHERVRPLRASRPGRCRACRAARRSPRTAAGTPGRRSRPSRRRARRCRGARRRGPGSGR